jgi:hypothetical protein
MDLGQRSVNRHLLNKSNLLTSYGRLLKGNFNGSYESVLVTGDYDDDIKIRAFTPF